MQKFDLNYQYSLYLKMAKLDESKMPEIQKAETKRAFMGGIGQAIVLLRDDITLLPEDKACEAFEKMFNQVGDFWLKENNRGN